MLRIVNLDASTTPEAGRYLKAGNRGIFFTAKRLCNKAQGCRAARLPWDKWSIGRLKPERVSSRTAGETPIGVEIVSNIPFPG